MADRIDPSMTQPLRRQSFRAHDVCHDRMSLGNRLLDNHVPAQVMHNALQLQNSDGAAYLSASACSVSRSSARARPSASCASASRRSSASTSAWLWASDLHTRHLALYAPSSRLSVSSPLAWAREGRRLESGSGSGTRGQKRWQGHIRAPQSAPYQGERHLQDHMKSRSDL